MNRNIRTPIQSSAFVKRIHIYSAILSHRGEDVLGGEKSSPRTNLDTCSGGAGRPGSDVTIGCLGFRIGYGKDENN